MHIPQLGKRPKVSADIEADSASSHTKQKEDGSDDLTVEAQSSAPSIEKEKENRKTKGMRQVGKLMSRARGSSSAASAPPGREAAAAEFTASTASTSVADSAACPKSSHAFDSQAPCSLPEAATILEVEAAAAKVLETSEISETCQGEEQEKRGGSPSIRSLFRSSSKHSSIKEESPERAVEASTSHTSSISPREAEPVTSSAASHGVPEPPTTGGTSSIAISAEIMTRIESPGVSETLEEGKRNLGRLISSGLRKSTSPHTVQTPDSPSSTPTPILDRTKHNSPQHPTPPSTPTSLSQRKTPPETSNPSKNTSATEEMGERPTPRRRNTESNAYKVASALERHASKTSSTLSNGKLNKAAMLAGPNGVVLLGAARTGVATISVVARGATAGMEYMDERAVRREMAEGGLEGKEGEEREKEIVGRKRALAISAAKVGVDFLEKNGGVETKIMVKVVKGGIWVGEEGLRRVVEAREEERRLLKAQVEGERVRREEEDGVTRTQVGGGEACDLSAATQREATAVSCQSTLTSITTTTTITAVTSPPPILPSPPILTTTTTTALTSPLSSSSSPPLRSTPLSPPLKQTGLTWTTWTAAKLEKSANPKAAEFAKMARQGGEFLQRAEMAVEGRLERRDSGVGLNGDQEPETKALKRV